MKQRVLLVDDDKALLDGLGRVLRHEPYEVHRVQSAPSALEFVERTPVDVVVTDQQMPGMSGIELLGKMRAQHPGTMCIMLTGKANLDVALKAINSGEVFRFFTKPCKDAELIGAIRDALKQRALIAQSRKLVDLVQNQSSYIAELEKQNPGISRVQKTEAGAVLMDQDLSLDDVLTEVTRELERAETHKRKSGSK